MRGILECWIKQAPRIELFKKNQCNKHALHCKFHLTTGAEVYNDEEYYHLQVKYQFIAYNLENFIQVLIISILGLCFQKDTLSKFNT